MTRQIITIPANLVYGSFSMQNQRFDIDEVSDLSGEVDAVIYGHPRWKLAFTAPDNMELSQSSMWEVLTMKLKGKQNRLAVYDPVRLLPRGTARGVMTLNASAAKGAEQIQVNAGSGQAGTTLLEGDLLQVGTGYGTSQLVKVMANATLNGSGIATLDIGPYLRQAFSSGASVIYDKPVAYFGTVQGPSGWSYSTNAPLVSGFAMDMLEQWT